MMGPRKAFFLILYYGLCRKLPRSTFPVLGPAFRWARYCCCRNIFKACGTGVNIERNAYFGSGLELEIGDFSGIGPDCEVPANIKIGAYVMMAPEVFIPRQNHEFGNTAIPMARQGIKVAPRVVIGDDVWIGRRAIINPGRQVRSGSILAAGTVLTRDYPEYSIIGGNPSRLIRSRLFESQSGDGQ